MSKLDYNGQSFHSVCAIFIPSLSGGGWCISLLLVHFEAAGEQVVHYDNSHVLGVAAITIEPEELGKQRSRVLLQVHVVAGQQLLQEVGLLVLNCLEDEHVVLGDVEDGSRGSGVAQLDHRS